MLTMNAMHARNSLCLIALAFLLQLGACDRDELNGIIPPYNPLIPPAITYTPVARFNAHHNRLLVGSKVHFFDLSINKPTSLLWDFGDGFTSKEKNPVHAYLEPGTYAVTLIAANAAGSDTLIRAAFITIEGKTDSTVHDPDGNIYTPVTIGTQTWLKENIKTTCYASGDPLMDGRDAGNLDYDTLSKYYFSYEEQDSNISAYGRLYTWPAAMAGNASSNAIPSGVQGICPRGWHIPSDAEWMQLEMFLGMTLEEAQLNKVRGEDEGGKLKEAGTAHWQEPNADATDEFGFTAMPGGERFWSGQYYDKGKRGSYWSATRFQHNAAWQRWFYHKHGKISRADFNRISVGSSVRCMRD